MATFKQLTARAKTHAQRFTNADDLVSQAAVIEAYQHICAQTRCLEHSKTITFDTSKLEGKLWPLPLIGLDDLVAMRSLWMQGAARAALELEPIQVEQCLAGYPPAIYSEYVYGMAGIDRMLIYPQPQNGQTATARYAYRPSPAITDTPAFGAEYHDLIEVDAIRRLIRKHASPNAMQILDDRYMDGYREFRRHLNQRRGSWPLRADLGGQPAYIKDPSQDLG